MPFQSIELAGNSRRDTPRNIMGFLTKTGLEDAVGLNRRERGVGECKFGWSSVRPISPGAKHEVQSNAKARLGVKTPTAIVPAPGLKSRCDFGEIFVPERSIDKAALRTTEDGCRASGDWRVADRSRRVRFACQQDADWRLLRG
jgi:hypothetical protein